MSQEVWWNKKENKHCEYKGRKNKLVPENEEFVKICKLEQKQLKNYLAMFLYEVGYEEVTLDDGFIYAKGSIPFCLTAHMDTVHQDVVKTTYEFNKEGDYIISSSQGIGGDDRCGIYMITELLKKGYKPYVVFCEDEEIGCVGSKKFCKTKFVDEIGEYCKYIIELDRANNNDAVFYDCDNEEFEKFITENTGYKTAIGSCSDISYLCPATKIAGVNLSCGYYNPHTLGEYVNMTEMQRTQDTVEKLLNTECVQYEYIERAYGLNHYYGLGYGYGNYFGTTNYAKNDVCYMEITYNNRETGKPVTVFEEGYNEDNCWTSFFMDFPDVCFNDVVDWDYY